MRYVAMRFAVRFLRHQWRSIPWRMIANQSAKIGDLRIQECRDEVLHRYVRAAKLFSPICSGPARWFNTKAWRPSSPSCCDRRRFSPTDDLLLVAVGPYSARVNCLSARARRTLSSRPGTHSLHPLKHCVARRSMRYLQRWAGMYRVIIHKRVYLDNGRSRSVLPRNGGSRALRRSTRWDSAPEPTRRWMLGEGSCKDHRLPACQGVRPHAQHPRRCL